MTRWKGINGEVAETLDANYYRGCGERGVGMSERWSI